jgi:hypothetical protein
VPCCLCGRHCYNINNSGGTAFPWGHDKERPCELSTAFISGYCGSDCIFRMGLLDEGLATTEGLRDFSRAISNIRPANEVHAFGLASVLVALLAAVALYAGWCGGTSGALRDCSLACLWECSSRASTRFQISLQ